MARPLSTDRRGPGAEPRNVVVVGNLYAPPVAVPTGDGPVPATGSVGAAFGEAGWTCWLEDLRLELAVETADPALPALQDIIDPVAARDLLQQVVVKAGYGEAVVTACRPNVVRYKPGSRCTVVVGRGLRPRQRQPARPGSDRDQDPSGRQGADCLGGHDSSVAVAAGPARRGHPRRAAWVRPGAPHPLPRTDPGGLHAQGAGSEGHR